MNESKAALRWVCETCALALGGDRQATIGATAHMGDCDKCGTHRLLLTVWDWGLGADGKPRKIRWYERD